MTTQAHGDGAHNAHDEHPPTSIREYVMIGAALTVVTAVELWVSYNGHIVGSLMIPILFALSAFKFAVVVAMFMHLRFEHGILTRLFACGLVLGTFVILALIGLFWNDRSDAVGGNKSLISDRVGGVASGAAPAKAPETKPAGH